jgi:hypothetical protein
MNVQYVRIEKPSACSVDRLRSELGQMALAFSSGARPFRQPGVEVKQTSTPRVSD